MQYVQNLRLSTQMLKQIPLCSIKSGILKIFLKFDQEEIHKSIKSIEMNWQYFVKML